MSGKNIPVVHWKGNKSIVLIKAKATQSPDRAVDRDPSSKTQHYASR